MADSFRNSAELSFGSGEEFNPNQILTGANPVIAKSYQEGVRDTFGAFGSMTGNNDHIIPSEGSEHPKRGQTIDIGFNDKGLV